MRRFIDVCTQVPAERLGSLQDLMAASLAVVSRHQTQHLVSALGLLPLAPLLQPGGHTDGTPLSTVGTHPVTFTSLSVIINMPLNPQVPGCHPAAISALSARLDSWLAAPDLLLLPATRLLVSSAHRSTANTKIVLIFLNVY